MKIILNADDFGLSKKITDNIFKTYKFGSLNRTSIVPNGSSFNYAAKILKKNTDLKFSIHLNLCEGKSLSSKNDIDLLVDNKGYFKRSFFSLFLNYYILGRKKIIVKQLRKEINTQLKKIKETFPKADSLCIDSHQHFHMLPFIFDIIIDLSKDFKIKFVRLPYEPMFFIEDNLLKNIKYILSSNIIKHILLNLLSLVGKKKLNDKNLNYNDYFIGVLFTGNMSLSVIKSCMKKIIKKRPNIIEILFHPGGSSVEEKNLWSNNVNQSFYYLKKEREQERKALNSDELKKYLNKIRIKH